MSKKSKNQENGAASEAAQQPQQSEWMKQQVVPVAEIKKFVKVSDSVTTALKSDPGHAYSVFGLVFIAFSLKVEEIPQKKDGAYVRMANQVRAALRRLRKAGQIQEGRSEHEKVYYWSAGAAAPAAAPASA
jgi:hypothetical protein